MKIKISFGIYKAKSMSFCDILNKFLDATMQYFSYAILLTSMLFLCIETQAFCIYNNLDEGGSFEVYDEIHQDNDT
jgi:hypothetical protein